MQPSRMVNRLHSANFTRWRFHKCGRECRMNAEPRSYLVNGFIFLEQVLSQGLLFNVDVFSIAEANARLFAHWHSPRWFNLELDRGRTRQYRRSDRSAKRGDICHRFLNVCGRSRRPQHTQLGAPGEGEERPAASRSVAAPIPALGVAISVGSSEPLAPFAVDTEPVARQGRASGSRRIEVLLPYIFPETRCRR